MNQVLGGDNLYQFAPNIQVWGDWLGLAGVDMNLFPSNEDTSKPGTMRSFTPQSKKISKEHANYGNTNKFLNFIFVINPFNIM